MQKQPITINFSSGLDTKTDPKQIQVGKFTSLQNTVFTKAGLLQKRNGFPAITSLTNGANYLTTLNGNLTAIGSTISAFSQSLDNWITKGTLQPCGLNVLSLIKNNLNQIQVDTAIANGMVLTVYTSQNNGTNSYYYALADQTTGQNIIEPTAIPVVSGGSGISGSSRVFVIGNYFVVVNQVSDSGTYLQYFSIPTGNPVNLMTNVSNASPAQKVTAEVYAPITSNLGWDGVVANNTLVIAYNSTTTAQGVHVTSLTQAQIASNSTSATIKQFNNAAYIGAIVSMSVDTTNPNLHIFYVNFWNSSTTNAYILAVTLGFGSITQYLAPTETFTSTTILNLASVSQNGSCLIFAEISNNYSYDSAIPSHYIEAVSVTNGGTVGSVYTVIRGVGLGSKAFIVDGVVYFLSSFQSPFQPTYFLINGSISVQSSPVIVAKLAYENGGGYLTIGLPSVNVSSNIASIGYLYKDLIESLNTLDNPQQTTAGGIYAQTGINLVNFSLGTESIDTSEIAQTLHITGGFLGMYDGYLPVEHNFFLWPDSVEVATNASAVTPTGTVTSGSPIVTAVSSMVGIGIGASITGTAIPGSTKIIAIGTNSFTMSANATGNNTAESLSIAGNVTSSTTSPYYYQAIYRWTDNNGLVHRSAPSIPVTIATTGSTSTNTINVPTLRLTQKVANPVIIDIYRWSTLNQVYYKITSVTAPLLNSTIVDSVVWYDSQPDSAIVGNEIIYTNGGVIEDVNGPACNGIVTLFDTRLWLVDAEDPNLLWYSKQVIEATPVEMSDLSTLYIAPNTGTTEDTGPITALAPMDDKLIIFKENAIYYINGTGPDNTDSNSQYSQPIFVTSTVGCTNQQSLVLIPSGLMFQSDKGIWLLNRGLGTEYIGAPVEGFTLGNIVTSANAIPETNQVRFTLSSGFEVMYDYYYQQWGDFVQVPAISSTIYNDAHTILSPQGLISQESPGTYLDNGNPVLLQFSTGPIWLAGITGFQRAIELILLGSYISPHKLVVTIEFDFGKTLQQYIITPTNSTGLFGSDSLYGQTSPFGGPGDLEEWRIPFDTQQCQSIQVSLQEIYDPSIGQPAGAGFTLSSMTVLVGIKKSIRPFDASKTQGSNYA